MTTALSLIAPARYGAKRSAPHPVVCVCGAGLPTRQRTGRPRLTCSARCRRQRDRLLKQQRRRLECVTLWMAEAGQGHFSAAQIAGEVQQLETELRALASALHGSTPDLMTSGDHAPDRTPGAGDGHALDPCESPGSSLDEPFDDVHERKTI